MPCLFHLAGIMALLSQQGMCCGLQGSLLSAFLRSPFEILCSASIGSIGRIVGCPIFLGLMFNVNFWMLPPLRTTAKSGQELWVAFLQVNCRFTSGCLRYLANTPEPLQVEISNRLQEPIMRFDLPHCSLHLECVSDFALSGKIYMAS